MKISGAFKPPLNSISGIWVLVASIWLSGCVVEGASQTAAVSVPIPHVGEPFPVGSGEIYHRDFELGAGEFVHLVAEQHGVDVSVRLRDSDGQTLSYVNNQTGLEGSEELLRIVQAPGVFRFEIVGPEPEGGAGEITFRVSARRQATPADQSLADVDQAYRDARELLKKAKYHEAILKLRGTLATWARLEQTRREAETRHFLCRAHRSLNELDLAVSYCEQALNLYRSVDDRLMMAIVLNRAGVIRQHLGQARRSLAYFNEAVGQERAASIQVVF